VSLLKREGLTPEQFLDTVDLAIEKIKNDPDNISSRGARKGELKMESLKEIEALQRTREVVRFYEVYEKTKKERALMDYDDVLAYAVELARISEDVRATIRENYLYVLVDEHQDSSGIQNAFLEAVWSDTEKPNIFVVGDDRQLIYGFAGSSLEHFTHFRTLFGKAKEITLVENYRSTQTILDAADSLLKSSIADGKLHANSSAKESKLTLFESDYPRDEIIYIAREIQKKIDAGIAPQDCAILVPKNHQVRSAVAILRDQGIPVSANGTVSFFTAPETKTIRDMLKVIVDPYDNVALASLMLDEAIGIPPITTHTFLREVSTRKLSLFTLTDYGKSRLPTDPIARFGSQLADFLEYSSTLGLHSLIQKIGEEIFFNNATDHEKLIRRVEVIRTFIHLVEAQMEKHTVITPADFLLYLARLEEYGHEIPLAVFSADLGVRVLTLHGSKGLEFKHVYVAHLDESSLMKGHRLGFTLPEAVESLIEAKNELVARRELYVAITRAKENCTLSFSRHAYSGAELEPARILADLPESLVEKKMLSETEKELLDQDPTLFVTQKEQAARGTLAELISVVAEEYSKLNVSVTLLNNFFECSWKWYFRNLLQLPEAKTESLLLGSAVHTGIEYILKNREELSMSTLDGVVKNALEREYIADEKFLHRIFRESQKILSNFIEVYLPSIAEDAQSERSVTYRDPKLPHLTCYGKIDMTEREEDRVVVVTDFKTGGAKSKNTIEKMEGEEGRMSSLLRQLAMYSYLIENAEKGTEVSLSKLLFIEAKEGDKDAEYAKKITSEEIAMLQKDIADYDEYIRTGAWTTRPCEAKLYGKNQECEYCTKAKLLYN
jgi:DNA helicase-2/ATP-dependent DNA helicase PcrA